MYSNGDPFAAGYDPKLAFVPWEPMRMLYINRVTNLGVANPWDSNMYIVSESFEPYTGEIPSYAKELLW